MEKTNPLHRQIVKINSVSRFSTDSADPGRRQSDTPTLGHQNVSATLQERTFIRRKPEGGGTETDKT
jgi:hypothetical protein